MDASTAVAVLTLLAADDGVSPIMEAIPAESWDVREEIVMPDGVTAILGTIGLLNVWCLYDGHKYGRLEVHAHRDAADAAQCHERNVSLAHSVSAPDQFGEAIRRLGGDGPMYV